MERILLNTKLMHYLQRYFLLLLAFSLLAFSLCYTPLAQSANNLTVKIEGLNKPLLTNVRESLSIVKKDQTLKNQALSERTIRSLHARAKKQIEQALQPFGFYQVIISPSLTQEDSNTWPNGTWQAIYRIDTGPATTIAEISLNASGQGKEEGDILKVLNTPPMHIGDQLNHPAYKKYKQRLLNTAYESGYLDAHFTQSELRINIKKQQATIVLELNTGLRYYFGDITIEQNSIAPELIQTFISTDKNTPFRADHLLDLQLKLADSGYFNHIDIDVQRSNTHKQRIPVVISATPSKKLRYSTSIGYGTDTGARGGLTLLNRRVNKQGHNLKYGLRLSSANSILNAQYVIPIGNIHTEYIDFSVTGDREVVNDFESIQYNIGTSLNQNRWGGRRQLSLSLAQESFSFDDEPDKVSSLLIPKISYSYKKTDNLLFSRNGHRFSIDIHGSSESFLSDTSFLYSHLNAKVVMPIDRRSRFISRLDLGLIATNEFSNLPPSERFFAGGSESVRGFRYKDIGVRSVQGSNLGGTHLFVSSIEVDRLLYNNIGIATFLDIGSVTNDSHLSIKTSVGLGLRYLSPLGMIRVDLAHPIEEDEAAIRLHIGIGPDL